MRVYLAGPVSNCNERQKTEWRKTIKKDLRKLGHTFVDPADHTKHWHPFKEMVEIDKCDVVIANIWKESIGTVVGIIQARRKGKPVILIDPNYLDSFILKTIVSEDYIVHGLDHAVRKLQQDIVPQLTAELRVRKRNGSLELFTFSKLRRSLNTVCAGAQLDDAVLPDLLAGEVKNLLRRAAQNGVINTDQIRRLVFEQLDLLARPADKLYEDDLKERAGRMKDEWERQQRLKPDKRTLDELAGKEKQDAERIQALEAENQDLRSSVISLRQDLRRSEKHLKEGDGSRVFNGAEDTDMLEKDYANYFPNLVFENAALGWLCSDRENRRRIEGKLKLMNMGQIDGKHQVPGTEPLVWQHDAGHGLKVYFRHEGSGKTAVLRIGTKGTQDSDYNKLRKSSAK